jgi:hypothetical protein
MASDNQNTARTAFIFGEPPDFFTEFESLEQLDSPFKINLLALRANLLSGLRVGTIPFQLVQAGVLTQRFNKLVIGEKIRCRTKVETGEISEEQIEETATRLANARMAEELATSDVIERHAGHTLAVLSDHLRDNGFLTSAQELLRQIVVIAWGALEIFANDAIKVLLNERPKLIGAFAEVKPYRGFFRLAC